MIDLTNHKGHLYRCLSMKKKAFRSGFGPVQNAQFKERRKSKGMPMGLMKRPGKHVGEEFSESPATLPNCTLEILTEPLMLSFGVSFLRVPRLAWFSQETKRNLLACLEFPKMPESQHVPCPPPRSWRYSAMMPLFESQKP